eukprot:gene27408-33102_t
MSQHLVDQSFLPNLPGFRARPRNTGSKKHYFKLVNGAVFLKDENIVGPDDDNNSVGTLGQSTVTKARKMVHTNKASAILNFTAYFEETIPTSPDPLIRSCNILFYTEDGSLKVVEKPVANSGVTQGTLVKRGVIHKPNGTPIMEEDFRPGQGLQVFARKYIIVDADPFTRDYMAQTYGINFPSTPMPLPEDPYLKTRKSMEAGTLDSWDKFRSKKDESKIFIEAKLGNTVDNKGREGFMKYGTQTLKFRCIWDNTENLYGDVLEFSMMYYLNDDTVEINSIPSALTKDGVRQKLLKRSRLPRDFHSVLNLGERPPASSFFHWKDLYIGMQLEVYARTLRIVDADQPTRDFYSVNGVELANPIVLEQPEVVVHAREVPPPTGFGSEEDSLRSVAGSLMPGPPPTKKYGENKQLTFLASLLSGTVDDKDRRFVISFYVMDNTLKVMEPPLRNSGFTGGTFLSRRTIKKLDGTTLTYDDLYVGCRLRILMHEFKLLSTSDGTLRWMEDKGLPRSNFYAIVDKIRPHVLQDAKNGFLAAAFQEFETEEGGAGRATKEAFEAVLSRYGLVGERPEDVSEHEMITVLRANGNKLPTFNYEKFIEQIISPTDEFK